MSDWLEQAKQALSSISRHARGTRSGSRRGLLRRVFAFESLEPRLALSVAPGLVPVGTQPAGSLSGKIVFTSGRPRLAVEHHARPLRHRPRRQ